MISFVIEVFLAWNKHPVKQNNVVWDNIIWDNIILVNGMFVSSQKWSIRKWKMSKIKYYYLQERKYKQLPFLYLKWKCIDHIILINVLGFILSYNINKRVDIKISAHDAFLE